MNRPRFVIEASEAESMAKQLGKETVVDLLPALVKPAQSLARPSISNYHVGAVGTGPSGRVFVGVNLEFPGLPLHQSVHAEQFLVTNLSLNAEPSLTHFAVSSAPCGHCRQFLQELRLAPAVFLHITESPQHHNNNNNNIINDNNDTNNNPNEAYMPLRHFLPNRFGPDVLLEKDVPLVLEKHENEICLIKNKFMYGSDENCCCGNNYDNGDNYESNKGDLLVMEALEAAKESHAPYSKCPSGVALMDCEGKVYRGSYTESAAYNPSLGPVQSALVAYLVGCGGGYERIMEAVLVEKDDAVVRQECTARLLLQVVAPNCVFRVVHCCDEKRQKS